MSCVARTSITAGFVVNKKAAGPWGRPAAVLGGKSAGSETRHTDHLRVSKSTVSENSRINKQSEVGKIAPLGAT